MHASCGGVHALGCATSESTHREQSLSTDVTESLAGFVSVLGECAVELGKDGARSQVFSHESHGPSGVCAPQRPSPQHLNLRSSRPGPNLLQKEIRDGVIGLKRNGAAPCRLILRLRSKL